MSNKRFRLRSTNSRTGFIAKSSQWEDPSLRESFERRLPEWSAEEDEIDYWLEDEPDEDAA